MCGGRLISFVSNEGFSPFATVLSHLIFQTDGMGWDGMDRDCFSLLLPFFFFFVKHQE